MLHVLNLSGLKTITAYVFLNQKQILRIFFDSGTVGLFWKKLAQIYTARKILKAKHFYLAEKQFRQILTGKYDLEPPYQMSPLSQASYLMTTLDSSI